MRSKIVVCVDKTIGHLSKVRTPRRLKKNRWITKTRGSKYITLHLVLTQKSEIKL